MGPLEGREGRRERTAPAHGCPTRRLVSWVPAGMSDWPGRVCTSLVIAGCSFGCAYCSASSQAAEAGTASCWESFLEHAGTKRAWLDGAVVGGGEPTEDPDLPSLLAGIAELDLPVKLDTNGADPRMLLYVLAEGLVSAVSLDIKAPFERYDEFTGVPGSGEAVQRSVEILVASGVEHELRTTLYPGAVRLEELPSMAKSLKGASSWVLQQFRPDMAREHSARSATPYAVEEVRPAAQRCRAHLPTVVRGFRILA